ncbi:MAG: HD domain-containing protein [Holophagales bacterium]|jgi:HD-GYP domain-containing protein (c-di-GMP phosphodiesterase class II)|nr:HD domain-containing protein [Holophagales bacterium]
MMKALLAKLKKGITLNWLPLTIIFVGITIGAVSIYGWVKVMGIIEISQQNIRGKLLEAAKRLATLTTAEELDKFHEPADAAKPEWKVLRQKLIVFAKEADVKYAYYMRVVGDKIQYIVDNDFDEKTRVGIDKELKELRDYLDLTPTLGGKARVAELGEYALEWPGLCSAYAPIFNSKGEVIAISGVDIDDREILGMFETEKTITILLASMVIFVSISGAFGFKNLKRMIKARTEEVSKLQNAIVRGLANMVESRDGGTGGHIERTQHYLRALIGSLNNLGLYQEDMKKLYVAGGGGDIELMIESSQLHDVGKIAISDSILQKPGGLTKEEFESMKKHVEEGVAILKRIESEVPGTTFLWYAKFFAAYHHERWDGSGYPSGLAGGDIPLLGRLMAIADVYDALTSHRPYKEAFSHEEAVRIIREGRGTQFDPALVDAFEQVADQFALIAHQSRNKYIA